MRATLGQMRAGCRRRLAACGVHPAIEDIAAVESLMSGGLQPVICGRAGGPPEGDVDDVVGYLEVQVTTQWPAWSILGLLVDEAGFDLQIGVGQGLLDGGAVGGVQQARQLQRQPREALRLGPRSPLRTGSARGTTSEEDQLGFAGGGIGDSMKPPVCLLAPQAGRHAAWRNAIRLIGRPLLLPLTDCVN